MWLARIRQFSQPSEVQEPIELIRAGIHFHARGLVNTKAIQHNLDWVWPYWVERQFDPGDVSFLPRAFSFSHVNLTHRNWTAVGHPELSLYPIVDPRGLVTPLHDGWSLDFWLFDHQGGQLLPSRVKDQSCTQCLDPGSGLAVTTRISQGELLLRQRVEVIAEEDQPVLKVAITAEAKDGSKLVLAVRPYNPEGVQFIDTLESLPNQTGWRVNGLTDVLTSRPANGLVTSHYDEGDLVSEIADGGGDRGFPNSPVTETCDQGMATAASVFDIRGESLKLTVRVPLEGELKAQGPVDLLCLRFRFGARHRRLRNPMEVVRRLVRHRRGGLPHRRNPLSAIPECLGTNRHGVFRSDGKPLGDGPAGQ